MSGDVHIMVLFNNTTPQVSVFGDIDLTTVIIQTPHKTLEYTKDKYNKMKSLS
jgi:hypothetical protein